MAYDHRKSVDVLELVLREHHRAQERFAPMRSGHEGIAVIREEYLELEREVFANRGSTVAATEEAVQLAAMAIRFVVDLTPPVVLEVATDRSAHG